jgi:hypothetical protein
VKEVQFRIMLSKVIRYSIALLPYIIFLVLLGKQGTHGLWAAGATIYLSAFLNGQILYWQLSKNERVSLAAAKMKIAYLLFIQRQRLV